MKNVTAIVASTCQLKRQRNKWKIIRGGAKSLSKTVDALSAPSPPSDIKYSNSSFKNFMRSSSQVPHPSVSAWTRRGTSPGAQVRVFLQH